MTDLRLWEQDNELLSEWYNKDNILVKDVGKGDKCYIFFSSNDIYYPNTVEEFNERIVKRDRYEWTNMASSPEIMANAGRMIFVRDLYKQWYITGVSSLIDSHEKLLEKLRELAGSYRVITIGSSAGGYIAALAGIKLNAEACFDFSGQVVLNKLEHDFCVRMKGCEPEDIEYYDLKPEIEKSDCHIYYFYPAYNTGDTEIFRSIEEFNNVYGFGFNQKNHAATMMAGNMRFIVCRDRNYMTGLYERYKGKIINNITFFFRTAPIYMWIPIGLRETKMFIRRRFNAV